MNFILNHTGEGRQDIRLRAGFAAGSVVFQAGMDQGGPARVQMLPSPERAIFLGADLPVPQIGQYPTLIQNKVGGICRCFLLRIGDIPVV